MREIALDRAEADEDFLRRRARVLVGQGLNEEVGEFLGNVVGDGVDEMNQRAGLGAFLFDNRAAVVALAGAEPVVLRNGNDAGVGVFANLFEDDAVHLAAHVVVGETELAVLDALLVDKGIPVGMV